MSASQPEAAHIGPYSLISKVHTGGFAAVHRAVDQRFGTDVAVKILLAELAASPEMKERFDQEGRLLRRFASRELVPVHDYGELPDGRPYLVLAYADRGDLRARVTAWRAGGRFVPEDDALFVAEMLNGGLGRLHAGGVVHRDVTPGNVLIFSTGPRRASQGLFGDGDDLRLGDLGVAKDTALSVDRTRAIGTPGYEAPEQRQDGHVDARTDVYGASALLFWMLTGQHPAASRARSRAENTRALVANQVGDRLTAALVRGLDPDPDRRPGGIGDWFDALTGANKVTRLPAGPAATRSRLLAVDPRPDDLTRSVAGRNAATTVSRVAARRSSGARSRRPRRVLRSVGPAAVVLMVMVGLLGVALRSRGRPVTEAGPVQTGAVDDHGADVVAGPTVSSATIGSGIAPAAPVTELPPTVTGGTRSVISVLPDPPQGPPVSKVDPPGATSPGSSPTTAPAPAPATTSTSAKTELSTTTSTAPASNGPGASSVSPSEPPATVTASGTASSVSSTASPTTSATLPPSTSAPPSSSASTIPTFGTKPVSTKCGMLELYDSVTYGWRNIHLIPTTDYTNRAISIGPDKWYEKNGHFVGFFTLYDQFLLDVECVDRAGIRQVDTKTLQ